MILSKRLTVIKDMIDPCEHLVDVGCDHGFLTIAAIKDGLCRSATASDIREVPLSRASENINREIPEETDRVTLILSNGLDKIPAPGPGSILVIAGMGGQTMQDIIKAYPDKAEAFDRMILSPQSEIPEFRKFLGASGYHIEDERYLEDQGKLYVVMKVKKGEDACRDAASYKFGPCIRQNLKDPEVREAIEKEYRRILDLTETAGVPEERLQTFKEEAALYKEVLDDEA